MSEQDPSRLLRSLDQPVPVPSGLSAQIWNAVESELTGASARFGRSGRDARRRWNGPMAASVTAAVVLAVGFATWVFLAPSDQTPQASTTTVPNTTTVPQAPPDVVVGTAEDGFVDVLAALDQAAARWQPGEDFRYAYQVTVVCDCPDAGARWVRFFDSGEDIDPWDVIPIYDRIRADLDAQPDRVEVAFSPDDGHPTFYSVVWPEGSDRDDLVLGVDGFHEITLTATEFDGEWRFTSGDIDGTRFGNPVREGAITLTLDSGTGNFPIDCNSGFAPVDIYDAWFGVGPIARTAVGCIEYSTEAELFTTALKRVETIARDGSGLILTGPEVELRFVPSEVPESLGALPLTAAGEELLLEFPDGRSRGVIYTISPGSAERGDAVTYVLTAEADGVDSTVGWEDWTGEFDVPDVVVSGPGPDRVIIPETILEGDYRLCSPYWEPSPFCFDLLVRPPSAPWFVTAGADGVLLHDADGTSSILSDGSAAIAFLVGGRVVTQPGSSSGPEARVVVDDDEGSTEYPLGPGEALLDVAVVGGGPKALVSSGSGATSVLDLDTGDRADIGPGSSEALFHDTVVLLRPSADRVEARSLDGELLWEITVDAETMVVPADPGIVRLDRFGDLYTDSEPAFRQYLETRLVDVVTGEVLDSYEREVAIPLDGDEIADRCLRAELRDGLLLCPQPDGRMVTLEIEGGNTLNFPAGPGVGTYVRAGD
ncbi:MAG TPA: hypothetical protein VFZ15_03875 [Acidimicrobiia bacterium]|nr:hypothetical protein [Acidimicrobiia bacterium]